MIGLANPQLLFKVITEGLRDLALKHSTFADILLPILLPVTGKTLSSSSTCHAMPGKPLSDNHTVDLAGYHIMVLNLSLPICLSVCPTRDFVDLLHKVGQSRSPNGAKQLDLIHSVVFWTGSMQCNGTCE
jgi:hypothetical protein